MRRLQNTLDLSGFGKYNAKLHTFDTLTSAVVDLWHSCGSDLEASMTRAERNKNPLTCAHPYFIDLAMDRLCDANVPDALCDQVRAWLKKNP